MFLDFYKNHWKGILNFILFIFSVFVFLFAFKEFYAIAGSIIFGLIFFAFIEPLANFLHKRGVKKVIASVFSGLFIVGVFVGLSVFFSSMILNFIIDFSKSLPTYTTSLQNFLTTKSDYLISQFNSIPPDYIKKFEESLTSIIAKTSELVSSGLGAFISTITSSVSFFANVLLGYIFAIMLSIDLDGWKKFSHNYAPPALLNGFSFLKQNVIKGISTYLVAQFKLIFITFLVIFVALLFLGVENALTIAIIGGVMDVLPLLGVSTLFVPWIIYLFIKGNVFLAVSLTILLIVVLGTRQILEPKITGDSLGVNASVMLLGLILSTSILGFWGIFLSPILIILIKELIVQGYLETWFGWKPKDNDYLNTLSEKKVETVDELSESVIEEKKEEENKKEKDV